MKKFKKIFAVLLTLAMVLGMSMTSFAADPASFTVTGLKSGTKVSYAQILGQNSSTSQWELKTDQLSWTDGSPMTAESLAEDNVDLSELAGLGSLSYGSETVATADGSVTFSNLPAGLYAVKAVDPTNEYVYSFMIAKVDYENGVLAGSNLRAKGQKNVPEKEASKNSVVPGEEVTFTVNVYYPTFATGSTNKSMTIVDTVKNGTIVSAPGEITIRKEDGTDLSRYFVAPQISGNRKTLTISLNANEYNYNLAGEKVVIQYKVRADEASYDAVENKVVNTVPGSDGNNHSGQAIVILPNVDVTIEKVDEDNELITNSPATFALYKEVPTDYKPAAEEVVEQIDVFVSGDPSSQEKVYAIRIGEAKTTTDGKVTFEGLEPDPKKATYYVKETAAPDGYSVEPLARKLTGATITAGKPTILKEGDEGYTEGVVTVVTKHEATGFTTLDGFTGLKFKDTKLGSLPSTGGIGTTIFTIGGCAIMIIAAALFFASRRKSSK